MSEAFAREILRRNVAQICQTIGWNGINSTPLDILVHVLEKYICTLGTQANRYAEQFSRTEPNLDDLGLVFRDLHLQLPDLADYTRSVPPIPPPVSVDKFPKPKESNLNFLKPGSHEVVTRPMHVHEHLPPMYPEKERDTPLVADTIEIRQNGIDHPSTSVSPCQSPEISVTDSPEKQKDLFKRPIDPVSLPNSKRPRVRLEEEERTREITSVMMTMSGFLSPAREGKLPEAKPPAIISEKHEKHKINSHHSNVSRVPPLHKTPHITPLDKQDKKSKKSKLLNGKVMKSKRKDKSHKGESKSKDSSKLNKHPPGYPSKHKDIHPKLHNHITMPAPKLPPPAVRLPPPAPKTMLPPPPPPIVDNFRPVIKQEPVEPSPISLSKNIMPGEETIPVPRRIPISKSPLVSSSVSVKHNVSSALIPETEIKKEKIEEEEKLASQPDRSKVNIFKRITNKCKEDKSTSEVVHDIAQPENLISRLQSQDGLKIDHRNHSLDQMKMKPQEPIVNNNDTAVDLSKQINLMSNEVITLDDEFDNSYDIPPKDYHETRPNPLTINKPSHLPHPKDIPGISPKMKKEKKHKEKKDKSIEKAAKLLKKQQMAIAVAQQAGKMNMSNFKMSNSKPPKISRRKNESKRPHMPPGFPLYPPMPPGRGLMPGPGLIPGGDFLAGIANNPALRGLSPSNLLANPFALGAPEPGLIPGPSYLPGNLGPGLIPMSMSHFGQSSRSQSRNIAPLFRRPSLEVIPVNNDEERRFNINKSPGINPKEKERYDKNKLSTIPNILQKPKSKSHKESHKSNLIKMPPVQPDITIELNPPKPVLEIYSPVRMLSPVPEKKHEPVPEVSHMLDMVKEKEDKLEKKKDKSHKKEKKDKDGLKIKKKKDKKDKSKEKSIKKKDKEERQELKDRIKKEKKEKRKVKLADVLVPKLTFKLGSSSPMPPSSPDIFKLNIKPVIKKENDEDIDTVADDPVSREHSRSPELAQISALVTRPPKHKHTSKHNHVADQSEPKSPPQSSSSPSRRNHPPSGQPKFKRILLKPVSKKSHMDHYDDSEISSVSEVPATTLLDKPAILPTPFYIDEQGHEIWMCPACGRPDNGSPMIGCDGCDCWYHWICVGITEEPGVSEDWFCKSCMAKRAAMALAGVATSGKKRGRKPKNEKV